MNYAVKLQNSWAYTVREKLFLGLLYFQLTVHTKLVFVQFVLQEFVSSVFLQILLINGRILLQVAEIKHENKQFWHLIFCLFILFLTSNLWDERLMKNCFLATPTFHDLLNTSSGLNLDINVIQISNKKVKQQNIKQLSF